MEVQLSVSVGGRSISLCVFGLLLGEVVSLRLSCIDVFLLQVFDIFEMIYAQLVNKMQVEPVKRYDQSA